MGVNLEKQLGPGRNAELPSARRWLASAVLIGILARFGFDLIWQMKGRVDRAISGDTLLLGLAILAAILYLAISTWQITAYWEHF